MPVIRKCGDGVDFLCDACGQEGHSPGEPIQHPELQDEGDEGSGSTICDNCFQQVQELLNPPFARCVFMEPCGCGITIDAADIGHALAALRAEYENGPPMRRSTSHEHRRFNIAGLLFQNDDLLGVCRIKRNLHGRGKTVLYYQEADDSQWYELFEHDDSRREFRSCRRDP